MFVRKSMRQIIYILFTAALLLTSCNGGATPAPTTDVNEIKTAIVGTTVAQFSIQFTQTALAAPTSTPAPIETFASLPTLALATSAIASPIPGALPTLSFNTTPVAGFTPLATSIVPTSPGISSTPFDCNDAKFVSETLPDGSIVGAGSKFTQAWQIQNTGTCTWAEGYVFAFLSAKSSSEIKGYDIVINNPDEFTKPKHSQSFVVKLTAPNKHGEYKGFWRLKGADGISFGPLVSFDIIVK
jgi:hypothetical protein